MFYSLLFLFLSIFQTNLFASGFDGYYSSRTYPHAVQRTPVFRTPYTAAAPAWQEEYTPKKLSLPSALHLKTTASAIVQKYKARAASVDADFDISSLRVGALARSKPDSYKVPQFRERTRKVHNQEQLGSCASFATIECLNYIHEGLLSQAYLNASAERLDNCKNDGMPVGVAMGVAYQTGVVAEDLWPYEDYYRTVLRQNRGTISVDSTVCILPPFSTEEDMNMNKFGFQSILNIYSRDALQPKVASICDIIKSHMKKREVPVVLSVAVLNEEKGWEKSGIIAGGTYRSSSQVGYHAITLYGFSDHQRTFSFKNSWGTDWGSNGFGEISYDYVDRFTQEAWLGFGKMVRYSE